VLACSWWYLVLSAGQRRQVVSHLTSTLRRYRTV
jgi:hypothetical protein